jgi:hypothetical protein
LPAPLVVTTTFAVVLLIVPIGRYQRDSWKFPVALLPTFVAERLFQVSEVGSPTTAPMPNISAQFVPARAGKLAVNGLVPERPSGPLVTAVIGPEPPPEVGSESMFADAPMEAVSRIARASLNDR